MTQKERKEYKSDTPHVEARQDQEGRENPKVIKIRPIIPPRN